MQDKSFLDQWIEEHQAEMIGLLQKLVQTPSDNPSGDCYPTRWLPFYISSFVSLDLTMFFPQDCLRYYQTDVEPPLLCWDTKSEGGFFAEQSKLPTKYSWK